MRDDASSYAVPANSAGKDSAEPKEDISDTSDPLRLGIWEESKGVVILRTAADLSYHDSYESEISFFLSTFFNTVFHI